MQPILSIIIPMFQAEKYIDNCLRSLYNEKVGNRVEVILVDDGSKDKTLEKAYEWGKKYAWIRILHHDNQGVSYTRNRGIRQAQGEYIWFVDIDDQVIPKSIEKIIETLMVQRPEIYLFGYRSHIKRKQLNEFDTFPEKQGFVKTGTDEFSEVFWRLFSQNLIHNVGTKIYSRKLLVENGIEFKEAIAIHEDAIFCIEALKYAPDIYVSREVFYCYNLECNHNSLNHQYRTNYEWAVQELYQNIDELLVKRSSEYYVAWAKALTGVLDNEIRRKGISYKDFEKFCGDLRNRAEERKDIGYSKICFYASDAVWKRFLEGKYRKCYIDLRICQMANTITESTLYAKIFDCMYAVYRRVRNICHI